MYLLNWTNPSYDANKGTPIEVPVGSIVSNKASIRFTGKGAANYGTIQQENLMRLLENFASGTAPLYPTVGQEWYDTTNSVLRVCSSTSPLRWKSLGGIQITNTDDTAAPTPGALGDLWFQRTGTSSGMLYVYTGLGRYPVSGTTIGGWHQIYPTVEIAAGREEYVHALTLVNQLIGSTSVGGNGAIGKTITDLTNLTALEADLVTKFNATNPKDPNVLTPITDSTAELCLDPNSNDWDTLLAAAKYAIDRLELPTDAAADISPVPFVSDGRQAPASLTALNTADLRYPSLERRSNRRFGMVTLINSYAETMNILSLAVLNRYSLKGINGASGTNTTFAAGVTTTQHANISGALAGDAFGAVGIAFNFTNAEALNTFINSGGALQLKLSNVPGGTGTAADTNLKTLLDNRGVLRLTADKTRIFGASLPYTLAVAPIAVGIKDAPSGGVALTTQTVDGASYTITAAITTPTRLTIHVAFSSTGAMNGTLALNYEIIRDTSTYNVPPVTAVFGAPIAYVSGDNYLNTL